jgi:hypothetical protein
MSTNVNQNNTYTNLADIQSRTKTITSTVDVGAIKTLSSQFRGYIITKHLI